jgi:glutamyl-tRNA synthetase
MAKKVRTRFAPSPTGYLHIGGLRTALFEYAYAKTYGGKFILRIEDTDRKRYVKGSVAKLVDILKTFGLIWDEGPEVGGPYEPYIQSERMKIDLYKGYAKKLVKQGNAYYCFCKSREKTEIERDHLEKGAIVKDPCRDLSKQEVQKRLGNGEVGAIRLRVPDEGSISFNDLVLKKKVSWNFEDVDEAMLLKSDGYPTYHLGVVVDDIEMKVTHVLRGFEWLPSTPIHLLIYKYLSQDSPQIGHFSLVLDPEGGKLSKRKRNVSCEDFLADGYLPEGLLNFIMLLGWAPKDNRELFTLDEYVREFKNGNLQVANAIFNPDKLNWFNQQYIQGLDDSEFATSLYKYFEGKYEKDLLVKIAPLVKTRIKTLKEFESLSGFFFETPQVDRKIFDDDYESHLRAAVGALEKLKVWELEKINVALMKIIGEKDFKTGKFFMSLRIAITGQKFTPPINESIEILGKEETLRRLKSILK